MRPGGGLQRRGPRLAGAVRQRRRRAPPRRQEVLQVVARQRQVRAVPALPAALVLICAQQMQSKIQHVIIKGI